MYQNLRIVIADDEPDMREFLTRMLPRCGHQVVAVAQNGTELVRFCLKPDLVITDIKMPVDCIEAANQINREWPVTHTYTNRARGKVTCLAVRPATRLWGVPWRTPKFSDLLIARFRHRDCNRPARLDWLFRASVEFYPSGPNLAAPDSR